MNKATKRKPFPYVRVARLWKNGRTIAETGERIGYVDRGRDDGDKFHTLRCFLTRMHKGYRDAKGDIVRLPYRVSRKHVASAAKAAKSSDAKSTRTASKG